MNREIVNKRRNYVKENIIREEITSIAEKWGVHRSTIEKDLIFLRQNEGLKSKTELRDKRIKELFSKELKISQIAKDINVSERDVYYRIKKMGIG